MTRTVVIATGAQYRKPGITNLMRFEGVGVYYGATFIEAQICGAEEVIVVGGGNSAGQAAVFLAQTARHVHMLVRSGRLADTMSRYLIRRIEENPEITLRTDTEIIGARGRRPISSASRGGIAGRATTEVRNIRHVFMMTGATPHTAWLDGCVALDGKGFVKAGQDLTGDDLASARVAAGAAPVSARNQPARRVRGRRRPRPATSNASRPPSAKAPSSSASCTRCWRNKRRVGPRRLKTCRARRVKT